MLRIISVMSLAFILSVGMCLSVGSQNPLDSNIGKGSNTYTFCQYRKAHLKKISLPPSKGCSFLIGRWTGETFDGARVDETWLPFVDEKTLGIRRVFKETHKYECLQIAPQACQNGTSVQVRKTGQNLLVCGDLITSCKATYVPDEEAIFYFKPNSAGLDALIYTKTGEDQITVVTRTIVNGKLTEELVTLTRDAKNPARQDG